MLKRRGATGWRLVLALVLLGGLAACAGRPLAPGERALAADLFGPKFNPDRARIARLSGSPPPPPRPAPEPLREVEIRPGLCDRDAPDPGPPGPPPAFVLYNRMQVQPEFYRDDIMAGWPDLVLLPEVLIVAHELVHIWQWQNRALTGYRPAQAALENLVSGDPYFYVPAAGEEFLKYSYEQQAALIEDYMCYAIFDPANPRRAELRRILSPYFTMDRLDRAMRR